MKTMDAPQNLLVKHRFLTGLKDEFRDTFVNCASLRRFASNQQVFQEGTEADHFYLIVSGKVALETFVPGLGMVTVQSLGADDALGWSWLFPPYEWHFTATTQAPTEVISLDAAALRNKAEENRDFRDELLTRVCKTLLERLLATRTQLIDVYAMRP
jgi:CRP/FNR family transcriptional regulator, cyclic AMP receptor protein